MLKLTIGLMGLAVMAAGQASAQASVEIDGGASYDQALKCYRYYDVAQQVADARAGSVDAGSDEHKEFRRNSLASQVLKNAWNKQIEATKNGKTNKQVDADLEVVSGPIIADANAGLAGDQEAGARYDAIMTACRALETAKES